MKFLPLFEDAEKTYFGDSKYESEGVEFYYEKVKDSKEDTFFNVFSLKKTKQFIRKIDATLLKNTWLKAAQNVYIEKAIDKIASIFVTNVATLRANTELVGHTEINPDYDLFDFFNIENESELTFNSDELPYSSLEEMWEKIHDYIGDEFYSDYGLPKLEKLVVQLFGEKDYKQRVVILDKMLHVIHPRSDLASLFVEGGSNTLNKLFTGNLFGDEDDEDIGY